MKGIYFQKEFQRFYPDNQIAAQVLGYVGVDDKVSAASKTNSMARSTAYRGACLLRWMRAAVFSVRTTTIPSRARIWN